MHSANRTSCLDPLLWLFVLCCLIVGAHESAKAAELQGTGWERAAAARGLDPLLLYAVALTESGRRDSESTLRPWPWTLNIEGRPVFAKSKGEAAILLEKHRNASVDVGPLQVNIRWHGHRVDDISLLLEPDTNLEIGATVLMEALETAPGDLTTGIGRYHSSNASRGRSYARTVLAFYRHMLHQQDGGHAQ